MALAVHIRSRGSSMAIFLLSARQSLSSQETIAMTDHSVRLSGYSDDDVRDLIERILSGRRRGERIDITIDLNEDRSTYQITGNFVRRQSTDDEGRLDLEAFVDTASHLSQNLEGNAPHVELGWRRDLFTLSGLLRGGLIRHNRDFENALLNVLGRGHPDENFRIHFRVDPKLYDVRQLRDSQISDE